MAVGNGMKSNGNNTATTNHAAATRAVDVKPLPTANCQLPTASRTRGNRDKLERDADQVVRRIVDGEATVSAICAEYHVAYATLQKIYKPRTTAEQREAVRRRNLLRGNKAHRFKKGHTTWNKGCKGWCPEGSEKGWFKPGCIRGAAARRYRRIGFVTVRRDHARRNGGKRNSGKLRCWIKVSDTGRPQDRWITLARFNWIKANGPVPKGMSVMHRDGDTLRDSPDNLVLVARADQAALQRKLNPEMEIKRRRRAGDSARKRHARNRRMRLAGKVLKIKRPAPEQWDCAACGYGVDGEHPPDRCDKCGSSAFEPRPQRMTA